MPGRFPAGTISSPKHVPSAQKPWLVSSPPLFVLVQDVDGHVRRSIELSFDKTSLRSSRLKKKEEKGARTASCRVAKVYSRHIPTTYGSQQRPAGRHNSAEKFAWRGHAD